jgi:putative SOS response-associated peptidase YedK
MARWHRVEDVHHLTTDANAMMAELHDRMPIIQGSIKWRKPAGDDVLKVLPVSKKVNSPKNNGPQLLETVGRCRSGVGYT